LETFQNACVFHTKPPRAFGPFFTACRTALRNISRAEGAPRSVRGKEIARERWAIIVSAVSPPILR
jgi:hypothetical protein